ncbi:MAG: SpoIIIAH-like family protein [Firmicutes bacterium]|nr:SpoIIIAH-like family protein [Bacillota bacterium]
MKKFFSGENSKMHRSLAFLSVIALVCCVGIVNNRIQTSKSLSVSAGYSEYEQAEMENHNGDVLVDSLNLTQVPGSSEDAKAEETAAEQKGEAAEEQKSETGSTEAKNSVVVTSDDAAEIENTDAYFREARETLTYDRNEMISMLTDTIETSAEGSEKSSATDQKTKLLEYMSMEKSIESLIRNKGFTDALVIITDRSVNITVQAESLTDGDVAKILDIAIRETGRTADDIVVQTKSA